MAAFIADICRDAIGSDGWRPFPATALPTKQTFAFPVFRLKVFDIVSEIVRYSMKRMTATLSVVKGS